MSNQVKTEKESSNFFKSVRAELRKVTWPTKQELGKNILVVLVICTLVALTVWLIDSGLHLILSRVLGAI